MFGLITEVIKGGCTANCVYVFKQCIAHAKREGCSSAYTRCRGDLDKGELSGYGCKKKCKDTKTMKALKSKC